MRNTSICPYCDSKASKPDPSWKDLRICLVCGCEWYPVEEPNPLIQFGRGRCKKRGEVPWHGDSA